MTKVAKIKEETRDEVHRLIHQQPGIRDDGRKICVPLPYRLSDSGKPPMTDDMMNLRSLLERTPDLLPEMIGFAAERLMELKVGALTGAGHRVRLAPA